jgi:hypothetical protein
LTADEQWLGKAKPQNCWAVLAGKPSVLEFQKRLKTALASSLLLFSPDVCYTFARVAV